MQNIYKPVGLTPYQLIEKFRATYPEYKDTKIGFAGRLDPLAHGVMLLMLGDETKKREKYLSLPKEYEFEVLFGVSTDTYDGLGILQDNTLQPSPKSMKEQIKKFVKTKTGFQIQEYPPYSSKTVNGKPLYKWARENKLLEIKMPEKNIEIYNFELLKIEEVSKDVIIKKIFRNIKKVEGDFRQKEINKKWSDFFKKNLNKTFSSAQFRIKCSSGTYVRSLANELGEIIGTSAIALEILRTKVGTYDLKNSLILKK